jgi:ATP-binding cassette subfamily F protein uup
LSGGERNRLLLARLFARPANVLVLDEPTNDLDIETLELLEELLQGYEGTVFLVSHDRTFLDNVVTSTIAFEGNGLWREYEGGVQDWLIQSKRSKEIQVAANLAATSAQQTSARGHKNTKSTDQKKVLTPQKLSNKAQRELDTLQATIDALELEQAALRATLTDSNLYEKDPTLATNLYTRDAAIDEEMIRALTRWEELAGS